ncbi:mucin-5AC [Syngnathoides biaculeatus]|uniref:mucin-5AC n=1 Tax=Syngnathoides biaculeatus TaxID=300417 RepID=UPI002ADE741E|nr:mucin-5AC [Syngnathoides biaculeatus]
MDATEPFEAEVAPDPSMSQDSAIEGALSLPEQAKNEVSPEDATKTNGGPEPQIAPQAVVPKKQTAAKTQASSRSESKQLAAVSHHPVTNNINAATKTAAKPPVAPHAPKRPVTVATVAHTVKTPTRVSQRRPVGNGPSRTTSSATATATNGSKPTTANGSLNKRTAAGNVAKVKSSVSHRVTVSSTAASAGPKPSTSPAARVDHGTVPKKTRPPTVSLESRVASSASRSGSTPATRAPASATAAVSGFRSAPSASRPGNSVAPRPTGSAGSRTAPSRGTTLPSTARTTEAQAHPAAATTKDVSRPRSSPALKRPAPSLLAAKKPEPTKPPATTKPTSPFKLATVAVKVDPKVSQPKTQHVNPSSAKYSTLGITKVPLGSRKPLSRTQPASPANKTRNARTAMTKHETKPTQAPVPIPAVVKKTKSLRTQKNADAAVTNGTPEVDLAGDAPLGTGAMRFANSVPEVVPPQASTAVPPLASQSPVAACSPPHRPIPQASPVMPPPQEESDNDGPSVQLELSPTPVEVPTLKVVPLAEIPSQSVNVSSEPSTFLSEVPPRAVKSVTQVAPPSNLNDEEDEEERDGSQLVSVSEMSGTTQPTEESRPGSAGLVGGSAWRAGGGFLSELDSLSGSQQGASELSAPGVLEGTESMDDLGEGSLKGAMDMEGASAGSPDSEKVPDIPVNDYEDDNYDDGDRVCDMDVESEKTDELQRDGHDNDVDEEDEDVEMASEGVTESGLESYGNADEDDFAEDERLDNLNRLAQLPPPAPGAQWDRPNQFADLWEDQMQQFPDLVSQTGQVGAAASPLLDPPQANSETPSQSPAQTWLEISSDPRVPESQGVSLPSAFEDGAQMATTQCNTLHLRAPGQSSFPAAAVSSGSGKPAELGDGTQEEKPQIQKVPVSSPQHDDGVNLASGDLEVEAQTLPSDEVLSSVVNALASNPSSSSVTEDEASDTEGEALLDDSLESSSTQNKNSTSEVQSPAKRSLLTVEEVEECETGLTDDATPPSVTSLASYGFDSATTASNAQSAGEGCIKSPGIFSLEELPDESKGLCDQAQSGLTEQRRIDCGKPEAASPEEVQGSEEAKSLNALQVSEKLEDVNPPYFSAICEKTDNSFAGDV